MLEALAYIYCIGFVILAANAVVSHFRIHSLEHKLRETRRMYGSLKLENMEQESEGE